LKHYTKSHPQKNTLLKNAQANAESNFFKRVFFSPTQEKFLPTLLFLIKLFSPTHGQTANMTRHRLECKSLLTNLRADIGGHRFGRTKTASANSTYPKGGVSCSKDSFVVNGSLVFQIKFCGKSPALRVAAKR